MPSTRTGRYPAPPFRACAGFFPPSHGAAEEPVASSAAGGAPVRP